MGAPGDGGASLPWRYVIATNAFLEFLLPCLDRATATAVMTHLAGGWVRGARSALAVMTHLR